MSAITLESDIRGVRKMLNEEKQPEAEFEHRNKGTNGHAFKLPTKSCSNSVASLVDNVLATLNDI